MGLEEIGTKGWKTLDKKGKREDLPLVQVA